MIYKPKTISTRGEGRYTFSDSVIEGLGRDGGLLVPEEYPRFTFDEMQEMRELGYRELAFSILERFVDDIPVDTLNKILRKTYTAGNFGSDSVISMNRIDPNFYVEDISNGPTLAFKDMALQLLGNLFEHVLTRRNSYMNQLGASSGDTVSSAEYAAIGKKRFSIFMLTPLGGMSEFQAAQTYSILEPNVYNLVVSGVFDDCQDMVKAVSRDIKFKDKHKIGSVNSINWGRIAAQVVYYFKGYFEATDSMDQEVDFAVPTGNFGDIFAGYVAKQMGLPIRRLILATNENNVLDEFFKTGIYRTRKREDVAKTTSPSMDIAKASNLERYLFSISGNNPMLTRAWMDEVEKEGVLDLSNTDYFEYIKNSGIVSGRSLHQNRVQIIRDVYEHTGKGFLPDPHTADAIKVALDYRDPNIPLVCLGTAKPIKFGEIVKEALGYEPERPDKFKDIEKRKQRFVEIPIDVRLLKEYIDQHAMKQAA